MPTRKPDREDRTIQSVLLQLQAAAIEQQQKTPETQTVVVNHAAGQLKCFDSLSGRYFTATKNQIDKAVNEFNRQLRDDMRNSLNEWYDMIGLDQNKLGDIAEDLKTVRDHIIKD